MLYIILNLKSNTSFAKLLKQLAVTPHHETVHHFK